MHIIPFSKVARAIRESDARLLLGAIAVALVINVILARRLAVLARIQGLPVTTPSAVAVNLVAFFYRLFLPGGSATAGVARVYGLTRGNGRVGAASAAVVYDRVDTTVALLVVGVALWLVERPPDSFVIMVTMAACLVAVAVLFRALFLTRGVGRWVDRLLPLGARERLDAYRSMAIGTRLGLFALSLTGHAFGILLVVLIARGVGLGVGALTLGWVRSAVVVATLLPVSISGIGVREAAFVFLLEPYGVAGADAVAVSFLVFTTLHLVPGILGGLIEARRLLGPKR